MILFKYLASLWDQILRDVRDLKIVEQRETWHFCLANAKGTTERSTN